MLTEIMYRKSQIETRFPTIVVIGSIIFAVLMAALLVFKLITDDEFRKIWTVKTIVIPMLMVVLMFLFGWSYKRYKEGKKGALWHLIALLVSFSCLGLYGATWFLRTVGEDMAKNQTAFHVYVVPPPPPPEVPVTPNPPTTEGAVIRTSGEYLLTVPFTRDPKWAVFENRLILVKMSDSKTPLSLALQKIGPLHKPGTTPPKP